MNARNVKHVPGRKTDVNDAQWLQQLHQHGLLRGSFRPRDQIVCLRAYLRHRERLIDSAASHVQRMQKALMQMNVQLHHVVTDITGRTGLRIIRAIVAGTQAPEELVAYRDPRCRASVDTMCAALTSSQENGPSMTPRHTTPAGAPRPERRTAAAADGYPGTGTHTPSHRERVVDMIRNITVDGEEALAVDTAEELGQALLTGLYVLASDALCAAYGLTDTENSDTQEIVDWSKARSGGDR